MLMRFTFLLLPGPWLKEVRSTGERILDPMHVMSELIRQESHGKQKSSLWLPERVTMLLVFTEQVILAYEAAVWLLEGCSRCEP